nr:T-cell surface glycoprotein CD1b-3-like [Caretta caretta]
MRPGDSWPGKRDKGRRSNGLGRGQAAGSDRKVEAGGAVCPADRLLTGRRLPQSPAWLHREQFQSIARGLHDKEKLQLTLNSSQGRPTILLPLYGPTSSWHLTLCLCSPISLFLPPPGTSRCPSSSPALPVPDPFITQGSLGGELHPNGTSRGFDDTGVNGEDFISFDADAGKWVARQGDKLALYTQDLLNLDKSTAITLQFLLRMTCVNQIKSFVQHGKESLERQERPVAVVFARAPPPAGTPAPLLLVCRVTGFYPRPVRVAWLQDGEEVGPGGQLSSSGILPNADLTYQLRSSLAVGPGDGHSYACRVEHSSLGGQSLLIPWEQGRGWGPGLAVGITLGVLAVAAVAGVLWRSSRRPHCYKGVVVLDPQNQVN